MPVGGVTFGYPRSRKGTSLFTSIAGIELSVGLRVGFST